MTRHSFLRVVLAAAAFLTLTGPAACRDLHLISIHYHRNVEAQDAGDEAGDETDDVRTPEEMLRESMKYAL